MKKFLLRCAAWCGIALMRMLAPMPLKWIRALGWVLGHILYALARRRRHVVRVNLRLCFAHWSEASRRQFERRVMVRFAQSWLDRSWLWHGSPAQLSRRLSFCGDTQALSNTPRLVLFCPHFVGLDVGVIAITKDKRRALCGIYSRHGNAIVEQWIAKGRLRFGALRMFARRVGIREIANATASGEALYLLPDMDFGLRGAEFVPFFGVQTATVTSLTRLARLCQAQVMTLTNRMTQNGYEIHLSPLWDNFPSADASADTQRMNRELEALITQMPDQYYWVHKRFKTRPPGEPSVY